MSSFTPGNGENNDENNNDKDFPEWESMPDEQRVNDRDWADIVAGIKYETAVNAEVSAAEVADYLDEEPLDEHWKAAPPVTDSLRRASPALVISTGFALLGLLGLLFGAIFFRPIPDWLTLVLIAMALAGACGLFFSLPKQRRRLDGDDGSRV